MEIPDWRSPVVCKRIKQFFQAISASLDSTDHTFIQQYLDPTEQYLFYAMDRPTQRHCVNVAQTSLILIHQLTDQTQVSSAILIKSALLHDIGKPAGDLTTIYRIITVFANALSPTIGQALAKPGKKGWLGPLRHAFYIQRQHPQLGAAQAQESRLHPSIVQLIALHHQPPGPDDSPELQFLRQADDLN